jgi:hypothetical protein
MSRQAPLTPNPTTATRMAWLNSMGSSATRRFPPSQAISRAKRASSAALPNAASEFTFPVPKLKRGSRAWRLA